MILPDTNVWSALTKKRRDAGVIEWLGANAADLWLSTIVIGEIRFGIENPKAAARRPDLERWLADLETIHADRTLSFDAASAHVFGGLVARRTLARQETKLLDIQIAAQAIAHGMTVATRNVRDFAWTGVALIDPWNG